MFVCKSQEIMRKGGNIMFLLDIASDWQTIVTNAVSRILVPILIIGCSVGMIWAVVIGIKMMRADDKNAREEAKAKLINIAISIVAIAVLIGLFYALRNWLNDTENPVNEDTFGDLFEPEKEVIGGKLMNTVNLVKQCARMIIFRG